LGMSGNFAPILLAVQRLHQALTDRTPLFTPVVDITPAEGGARLEQLPPSTTYPEMVHELAAMRMVGQIVLFLRGLTIGSVLLCSWTATALYRCR